MWGKRMRSEGERTKRGGVQNVISAATTAACGLGSPWIGEGGPCLYVARDDDEAASRRSSTEARIGSAASVGF